MKFMRLITAVVSFVITGCLVHLIRLHTEQFMPTGPRFSKPRRLPNEVSLRPAKENPSTFNRKFITSKNRECFDVKVDWSTKVKPKYVLDQTKFLIPTLSNGPNNQMMGIQQSIILSLVLNRTLVLPLFYQHEIGKFFRKVVPPEYRLDMQRLREYVTVIPLDQAQKLCNHNFDVIFAGRSFNIMKKGTVTMVRVSMETGFHGVDFADDVGKEELAEIKKYLYSDNDDDIHIKAKYRKKQWWPVNRTNGSWTANIVNSDRHQHIPILPKARGSSDMSKIRSLYHTDAKCALHWFPFREYPFKKFNEMNIEGIGKVDLHRFTGDEGWKIQSEVIVNTRAPQAIFTWSKQFQQRYLYKSDRKYISMHWRFDTNDFYDYICKMEVRQEFCEGVKRATNVTAMANAVLIQIANLNRRSHIEIGAVYIAAPPTLNHLIQGVATLLTNMKFVRNILPSNVHVPNIFTSKQLKDFILKNYKDCEMAKPVQLSDTISQIEMDICTESYAFMWSRQSTWSVNVKRRRFLESKESNVDHSVLDFVLQNMNDENASS